jgi:predicted chitinase
MRAVEFTSEDISRRGFLGGLLGTAALGAVGGKDAEAKQIPLQPAKADNSGYNLLSNNSTNEITLHRAAKQAGMKGPELAQFLAQVKHESWNFDRLREKPQPGVKGYFAKKYDPKHSPRTAKILGNKNIGDGERFHGRGFIQLTGRDNYRMAGQALGINLLKQPELAEKPDIAAKIAIWYWNTRVKPNVRNFADTASVTRYINPAARGLADRHENFKDYMRIL